MRRLDGPIAEPSVSPDFPRLELGREDVATPSLWGFAWGHPQIDPKLLASAVEAEAGLPDLDFRTRLLIRDASQGLLRIWGDRRWEDWLNSCRSRSRIQRILQEPLGPPGFDFEPERLMPPTDPDMIRMFLRKLGSELDRPTSIPIGGAVALIMTGHLNRATSDIDIVDEVPESIRTRHGLLAELRRTYGLHLGHFASHYLPEGWSSRLRSLGDFGKLHVRVVDPVDVYIGKFFSVRAKDHEDLVALKGDFDRDDLIRRLPSTAALRSDARLLKAAEQNWYVLYGEPLPNLDGTHGTGPSDQPSTVEEDGEDRGQP